MIAYRSRSYFAFMSKDSSAVIRPVAFGGRHCHDNEFRLHSHLGEGFAGNWAINKNCHMLFGQRFVWVRDCYTICFILLYDGNNPAIACLQMRLMCWDVNIVHRNDSHLVNANYWLRLGADICFDPLFKSYLDFDWELCKKIPAPTALPMKPENMPYYQGPRITTSMDLQHTSPSADTSWSDTDAANISHCQSLFLAIIDHNCQGLCRLAQVPVCFGDFKNVMPSDAHGPSNHKIPAYAIRVLCFNWDIYSFGGGHFASTITSRNHPFNVTLTCDNYKHGHALFCKFLPCPHLFSSGNKMLHHIHTSGDTSQVHGYLIHSLQFWDSEMTSTFWQLQTSIVAQLQTLRNLQLIVAVIIPNHIGSCVKTFR